MDELSKSGNTDNVPSPFEFLLINCFHYKDFREIITEAFKFFIYEPVNFLYEEKKISRFSFMYFFTDNWM